MKTGRGNNSALRYTTTALLSLGIFLSAQTVAEARNTAVQFSKPAAVFAHGEVFLSAKAQKTKRHVALSSPLAFLTDNTREFARSVPTKMSQKEAEESLFANSMEDDDLNELRGAASFSAETLGVALLEAVAVQNNTQGTVQTGSNLIADNAFGNNAGVITVIQNSGNNTIIQNATLVNLTMKQ